MKPEKGGVWGAGVHMYVYREQVLPFFTVSVLCQLFNLHSADLLATNFQSYHSLSLTPSMTPPPSSLLYRVDLVTATREYNKEHGLWSLADLD